MTTPPDPGPPAPPAPGPADKVRFRFSKGGPLRWLSHHDLMRAFERMLRRAGLPFRNTQGFHPHPRIVFALSMPLGVVGRAEVAEVEFDEVLPIDETLARLRRQCPPGLDILDLCRVPPRQTARVRGLSYGLPVPADRVEAARDAAAKLLAEAECWVSRTRPAGGAEPRRLDIRPFLRDLRIGGEPPWLEMDLWLTPAGTARPEEVLAPLGLADLLEAGAVLHRLGLDIHSEG